MLTLQLKSGEFWSAKKQEFMHTDPVVVQLEHSLASISKWESVWCKPFISDKPLTKEEMFSYIDFMRLNDVPPYYLLQITDEDILSIRKYIESPHTATKITNRKKRQNRKQKSLTSERVYSWMFQLGIPIQCETWNYNRLMTLIEVCSLDNGGGTKMSKRETAEMYRALNQKRQQNG